MSYDELRDAYNEALRAYEAATAGSGDRAATFVQLVSTELALAHRLGRSPPIHCLLTSH